MVLQSTSLLIGQKWSVWRGGGASHPHGDSASGVRGVGAQQAHGALRAPRSKEQTQFSVDVN